MSSLILVGVFIALAYITCVAYRAARSCFPTETDSAAAQLVAAGYSLEVAFKDAADGFNACSVCGFENFKRDPFCRLCAAAIRARSETADPTGGGDHLGPRISASDYVEIRDADTIGGGKSLGAPRSSDLTLSKRQQRVRKRREWLRRLDVNGNLFWYRDCVAE
ncbi:hypothetical protein Gpo141_00013642, partial [Globisporangium polare]